MSGEMFVGYLCATQIDGRIQTDGTPLTPDSPRLVGVFHGGTSQNREKRPKYDTVRLILIELPSKCIYTEDLDPRHVVMVECPD